MGVAPGAVARVEPEMLVADVEPAGEGDPAIDHDELAVVAVVDLEPSQRTARPARREDLDPGGAQVAHEGPGQAEPAERVMEQGDRDAGPRPLHERVLQPLPDAVVADDVELDENIVLGGRDGLEDGAVGVLPVDQEVDTVAAARREPGEPLEGRQAAVARPGLAGGTLAPGGQRGLRRAAAEPEAAVVDIAEDEVEQDPRDRHRQDEDRPGDRTLRRPRRLDRPERDEDGAERDDGGQRGNRQGVDHPVRSPAR